MTTVTFYGVTYKVLSTDENGRPAVITPVTTVAKRRAAKAVAPKLFDLAVVHSNSTRDSLFHVHSPSCADLKNTRRYSRRAEIDSENGVTGLRDLTERYYPASDFDYDPASEIDGYACQFKLFPCTELPYDL